MRSVRYCKTLLNRLGTYNPDTDTWKGRFHPIHGYEFSLWEYASGGADVLVSPIVQGYATSVKFSRPAQQLRQWLLGPIYDLMWNGAGNVYYALRMHLGKVQHVIRYRGSNRGVIVTVPTHLEILWDAANDPGALSMLWDRLLDSGPNGRLWAERMLQAFPVPQVA